MNSRTIINEELLSVAPQLVNAPVTMPYTLPPIYFSQLPTTLLKLVKEDNSLTILLKVTPYQVPAGYFEQFAQSVLSKIKASSSGFNSSQQNDEPLLLSDFPRQMPYTVPKDYFNRLPTIILDKVAASTQQTVPEGYFESLSDAVLAKVRLMDGTNELNEVAPLLNTISRKPVQYVPDGYFENLQSTVEKTKTTTTSASIVPLKKKINWLRYAVAASIVFILMLGAYFTFNSSKTGAPSIANQPTANVINDQLASLDASTIENYLEANNAAPQTAFSADDLDKLNNSHVDELLRDFTDQQLKRHIEETPELPTVNHLKKPA